MFLMNNEQISIDPCTQLVKVRLANNTEKNNIYEECNPHSLFQTILADTKNREDPKMTRAQMAYKENTF